MNCETETEQEKRNSKINNTFFFVYLDEIHFGVYVRVLCVYNPNETKIDSETNNMAIFSHLWVIKIFSPSI